MNQKDIKNMKDWQKENCVKHSCKFADSDTVGTGKPCCMKPGGPLPDQEGNCVSWKREVMMYCIRCGTEWTLRGDSTGTVFDGYCGCGTKCQRKVEEVENHETKE